MYDSSDAVVIWSGRNLHGSNNFSAWQEYYIKVWTNNDDYGGTYQIMFNATLYPPGTTVTQLTANTWADGNLTTSSSEQWFKFTATASTQFIHVRSNTLGCKFEVYDLLGVWVMSDYIYSNYDNSSKNFSAGQEYFIKVSSDYSGTTFQIAFNTTIYPPGKL